MMRDARKTAEIITGKPLLAFMGIVPGNATIIAGLVTNAQNADLHRGMTIITQAGELVKPAVGAANKLLSLPVGG